MLCRDFQAFEPKGRTIKFFVPHYMYTNQFIKFFTLQGLYTNFFHATVIAMNPHELIEDATTGLQAIMNSEFPVLAEVTQLQLLLAIALLLEGIKTDVSASSK